MKATISAVALLLVVVACTTGGAEQITPPSESPTTKVVSTTASVASPTVVEETASGTTTPSLGDAPWAGAPLSQPDAPMVLAEQWNIAENRLWCSALAPADLGPEGAQAVPRAANFGGGWAVAWDNPDGPGSTGSSEYCPNCGRSAFGVAGVGGVVREDTATRMPNVLEWSDGSKAGYTGEGFDPSNPKLLGEIAVAGQGCMYQVWSHLGAGHLEQLINSLRFVEGLQAQPLTLLDPRSPPQLIEGGPAPWKRPALSPKDVPPLLLDVWERARGVRDIPLIAVADLGEGVGDARIRIANLGNWGVAWDNASGPGHDGFNQPCLDCGRGVIGLAARYGVGDNVRGYPHRIEWDDGSFAEYGWRLGDNALPEDRIMFNDPETGEPTVPAREARLVIAGIDAEFIVWSHLGEQHLLHLLNSLRLVEL